MKALLTFLVLLVLLALPCFGQITLEGEGEMDLEMLCDNPSVRMLYASPGLSFAEIRERSFDQPFRCDGEPDDDRVLWLRFEIRNSAAEKRDFYLSVRVPYSELYQQTDTGWLKKTNGYLSPLRKRTERETKDFLPLELEAGQTRQFYLRMQMAKIAMTNLSPIIGGRMYYQDEVLRQQRFFEASTAFSLIYFAAVTMIFFFISILYLSLREKIYLYYLLYLFFQIVYSQVIFSQTPLRLINLSYFFPILGFTLSESVQFVFIGFYILFVLQLLEIRKGRLYQVLRLFAWFCFAYAFFYLGALLLFPSVQLRNTLFISVRLLVLPANVVMIVWIMARVRHPLLIYFFFGTVLFLAGSVLSVTVSFLKLNANPQSFFHFGNSLNTIFQMGLLGEVFFFSFALAHRVRLIQKEKEKSTNNYIKQLQENKRIQEKVNQELDEKISEKTKELVEVYSQIEEQREKEIKWEFTQKINELEMIVFRTQMNPHFLFNSMNAIKHLILKDRPQDAMRYLDDFSTLLRTVLQNSNRKTISAEEELEVLELYLSLEKGRLGDRFHYSIEVDDRETLSQFSIPGLLLQPFVENAIWHGLQPSRKPEKKLKIRFDTSETLVISIEDNGIGRKASARNNQNGFSGQKHLGIKISRDRLSLYNYAHKTKIHLDITDLEESGHPSGTCVTFTYEIPEI